MVCYISHPRGPEKGCCMLFFFFSAVDLAVGFDTNHKLFSGC